MCVVCVWDGMGVGHKRTYSGEGVRGVTFNNASPWRLSVPLVYAPQAAAPAPRPDSAGKAGPSTHVVVVTRSPTKVVRPLLAPEVSVGQCEQCFKTCVVRVCGTFMCALIRSASNARRFLHAQLVVSWFHVTMWPACSLLARKAPV